MQDVIRQKSLVTREDRSRLVRQRGGTVWLTGLPASGKSTIAFAVEAALVQTGHLAYVLDGDNLRQGLSADLGFSAEGRKENIRRVGEVAQLFADTGVIVLVSLISPYREDREQVRETHRKAGLPFIEVFVNAPLSVCEARDPKGLYRRARAGELVGLTGIDAPYEVPPHADLVLSTGDMGVGEATEVVLAHFRAHWGLDIWQTGGVG